jgi:hypothetical protein
MSIRLSRRKIQQMIDTDASQKSVRVNNGGGSGGDSGGGSGGGGGVTWWQYSPTDDTITFLKRIASAVFDRLRVTTRLIFGGSDEVDTYITGIAGDNTAETSTHDIVTPNYGKKKYLSREHDDTAQGWLTVLQGIRTLETFLDENTAGGGLFTDDQERAKLVADVARIRDKVLGSLTIEDALSVLGSLNVHNSSSQVNSFADGTTISNYIAKFNGNARIDETLVALAGMYVNVVKSMNYNGDGPFDAGWMMTNNKSGHSYLVVDELFVRMKAIFTELEIRKISYAGGNIVFSHAGSKIVAVKSLSKKIAVAVAGTVATISGPVNVTGQVLNIDGGVTVSGKVATLTDNLVTYAYRCYAMKDDGTTATENWWHVNDQARCQTFNIVEPGTYQNAENTYYWRRVLNTGYEKIALTEGQTEENYDYVDLSVVDCDTGSDAPKAGDSIVQMGNRTDTDRMGFISLEVSGDDAPAIKVYKNVNGYTLNNKRKICISPKYTELHLQKMVIETEYDAQPVAMERGPWDEIPGHRCYYYNVVQYNGSSWLCIYPEEGIGGVTYTTEEPSENATYWQYYAKAGKDGKDGKSFNIQGTVNSVSELPQTGEEGQAWIVKINDVGHLYVWDTTSNTWKDSGQIQGDPGRGIQSVTVSYGKSNSSTVIPSDWESSVDSLNIQAGDYLFTRMVMNYTDETHGEPSYSIGYIGINGSSPVVGDIDNEVISIACDASGKTISAGSREIGVAIYNGQQPVTLNNISVPSVPSGLSVVTDKVNGKITISWAQGVSLSEVSNIVVKPNAIIDGVTYERTLGVTVNGVRPGADGTPATIYDIIATLSSIKKNQSGTPAVSVISATRQKTVGDVITSDTTDGTFKYKIDGGSEQTYTNNTEIQTRNISTSIEFIFRVGGKIVDRETIPVVSDGRDGESVEIDESNTFTKYQQGNSGTTAPTGTWQTTIPTVADRKFLWTWVHTAYSDGAATDSYSVSYKAANGTSVTITSSSTKYAITDNGTQPADSSFIYNSIPPFELGQYLWTKTEVTYSDGNSTKTYTVSRLGTDGINGLPAAYLNLSNTDIDIEVDENGIATKDFKREITYDMGAAGKTLFVMNISVPTTAHVSIPAYTMSALKNGIITVSGKTATITEPATVSGTRATLSSKYVALPQIIVNVNKGDTVTESNVTVNGTAVDTDGNEYTAISLFTITRQYYAPALQVVLSPEVIILTQNEQTKQIDLSSAYTDIVMRIGGTDITSGLGITAEVSQVEDRPTCSVSVNGNRVSITAINTTAAGSGVYFDKGYIDIHVTYQGNVYTQRFSFYCNLLGTWKETVENDTETAVAEKITYGYDHKTGQTGSLEAIGKYIRSSEENISTIQSDVYDGQGNVKLVSKTELKQTADSISLSVYGQSGINLLSGNTNVRATSVFVRDCYLYNGRSYTFETAVTGNGTANIALQKMNTNGSATLVWLQQVESGVGQTTISVKNFNITEDSRYQIRVSEISGVTIDWVQIEQGTFTSSNAVYHDVSTDLQRTGINIFNGIITLDATSVRINNGTTTAAMFTDGKIKGTYLQVTNLEAVSGTIGGFSVGEHLIKSSNNKIILNDNGSATIGKMSVDTSGNISATDVDLTGKITATSGKIGNFIISNGVIKSSESSPNISLDANGQSKIGNMTVALNGDITVSNMTANDGIFKGVIRAEKGLAYKIVQYTIAVNASQNMSNDDVVVYVKTTGSGGLGSQLPKLYLPNPEYGIGQMVYICNREGSTQTLRIMASNGHNIYPGNYSYIDLVGNGVICFVFDYVRGQWWQFSALNT